MVRTWLDRWGWLLPSAQRSHYAKGRRARDCDQVIFHLHGELLLGGRGSIAVELAASWAIVMIITGLFLWWPRGVQGLGGVLYPRLDRRGRLFWRDVHASAGVWVSGLTLFLLISGLPWSKSWGSYFKEIRYLAGQGQVQQDWPTGGRRAGLGPPGLGRDHEAMAMDHEGMPGMAPHREVLPEASYNLIDNVVPTVAQLDLAYPVMVAPPLLADGDWSARSDTPNRPLRVNLTVDGHTGAVLKRENFDQRNWVDRWVGVGVAAHEGQLFGWPNQLLSLFTALSLLTVSVSGVVMWWRRRPEGVLGAPVPTGPVRFSSGLLAIVLILGVLLPLLGGSLLAVFLVERLVLRRVPRARDWLGLKSYA